MPMTALQIPTCGFHSLAYIFPGFHTTQVTGRTWRGTAFGGVKGRTEIPGLVEGDFYRKPFIV